MGEYAEYILNGDDCQYCGEYLGEGDGIPRTCRSCRHWDICGDYGRDWRIRGEHGAVSVSDERHDEHGEPLKDRYPGWLKFPSVSSAFAFIAGHYMMEY